MTDAEFHQQQLEEQEQTVAHLKDEFGRETRVHVWSDSDAVFINFGNWPLSFTVTLEKQQAKKVLELLTNALRRAT